jgi:hypothetical protein
VPIAGVQRTDSNVPPAAEHHPRAYWHPHAGCPRPSDETWCRPQIYGRGPHARPGTSLGPRLSVRRSARLSAQPFDVPSDNFRHDALQFSQVLRRRLDHVGYRGRMLRSSLGLHFCLARRFPAPGSRLSVLGQDILPQVVRRYLRNGRRLLREAPVAAARSRFPRAADLGFALRLLPTRFRGRRFLVAVARLLDRRDILVEWRNDIRRPEHPCAFRSLVVVCLCHGRRSLLRTHATVPPTSRPCYRSRAPLSYLISCNLARNYCYRRAFSSIGLPVFQPPPYSLWRKRFAAWLAAPAFARAGSLRLDFFMAWRVFRRMGESLGCGSGAFPFGL